MQQELPQKRGWGAADVQLSLYSLGEKPMGTTVWAGRLEAPKRLVWARAQTLNPSTP